MPVLRATRRTRGSCAFLQEVDQFDPDLIMVSFGWNDAALAIAQPDKSFRVPAWPVVLCQRALVRYRSYLVLMYYARKGCEQPTTTPLGPRVSLDDYVANLERFRTETTARGIPIVFLTRPHRLTVGEQAKIASWRGTVTRYNAALTAWARAAAVPLIDVQALLEHFPRQVFADECHLTPEGYQELGELLRDQLVLPPDRLLWTAAHRAKPSRAIDLTSSTRRRGMDE